MTDEEMVADAQQQVERLKESSAGFVASAEQMQRNLESGPADEATKALSLNELLADDDK